LCQEVILGIGGVRMLRALGYADIARFHLNEGHASLLTIELLDEERKKANRSAVTTEDVEAVRRQCILRRTPRWRRDDQFPLDLVTQVIDRHDLFLEREDVFCCEGQLNLTYLALNLSHYVNGVTKRHGSVPADVRRLYDRVHHQRCACDDLDGRAVSAVV
jgi:starch phosphorylase